MSPRWAQIISQWQSDIKSHSSTNLNDDPNYYLIGPKSLITTSQPQSFFLGTGHQVLQDILPVIESAKEEVIFVTCFWAKSSSQTDLSNALRNLSQRALSESRRIRMRICCSSISLWQKLTHTAAVTGKTYAPESWVKTFGLPDPSELQGLELEVRSVFIWPFSVMHPKFVIVDRERLFLPSCNVSWEDWFEGCVELRGEIVMLTFLFWKNFWGRNEVIGNFEGRVGSNATGRDSLSSPLLETSIAETTLSGTVTQGVGEVTTILLPSPHHRNPNFRPFSAIHSPPPATPLNTFVLTILDNAQRNIYIQTPNVTAPPVLSAILSALRRGVDVRIVSNTRMMVVEQLVTAGKLTECALTTLHRKWKQSEQEQTRRSESTDLETGQPQVGRLEIFYYQAPQIEQGLRNAVNAVKSHLKLTIVDNEIVVLGSGNMDRASWYTSQELGIAFVSHELAAEITPRVGVGLEGCLKAWP
jgi:phosphatidylserine/phosphatidylglycerophosphate/cardiolipin synthase-like enzyme